MSVHSDCGKEIRWANRSDDPDRWFPPLEYAGEAWIISEDNVAVLVHTYRRHECDPLDMKKWFELKRAQAEIKGIGVEDIDAKEERALAKEEARKDAWAIACAIVCPTCEAPIGELCHNLSKRKKGITEYTLNPHPSRLENAWRSDGTSSV